MESTQLLVTSQKIIYDERILLKMYTQINYDVLNDKN